MGSLSQSLKLSSVLALILISAGCGGRGISTQSAADKAAAPTVQFSATPTSVAAGQQTTLNWSTTNATTVTIDGVAVGLAGTRPVTPTATTTYVLSATGSGGTTSANVVVTIAAGLPLP